MDMKVCKCDIRFGCICGVAQWERDIRKLEEQVRKYQKRVQKARLDNCDDSDDFNYWQCCSAHKQLLQIALKLREEAVRLDPDAPNGYLTANWWKRVGRHDMYRHLM